MESDLCEEGPFSQGFGTRLEPKATAQHESTRRRAGSLYPRLNLISLPESPLPKTPASSQT